MNHAYLLNEVGSRISAMNEAFVEALKSADDPTKLAIYKALALVGPAGLALAQLSTAVLGGPQKPTGLRPGQTVGDVGGNEDDPQYAGSIDPATLSVNNWAYYQAHNLGSRANEIFSGRQSAMNAALGKFHQGDLATAAPDAGPLAQFG